MSRAEKEFPLPVTEIDFAKAHQQFPLRTLRRNGAQAAWPAARGQRAFRRAASSAVQAAPNGRGRAAARGQPRKQRGSRGAWGSALSSTPARRHGVIGIARRTCSRATANAPSAACSPRFARGAQAQPPRYHHGDGLGATLVLTTGRAHRDAGAGTGRHGPTCDLAAPAFAVRCGGHSPPAASPETGLCVACADSSLGPVEWLPCASPPPSMSS